MKAKRASAPGPLNKKRRRVVRIQLKAVRVLIQKIRAMNQQQTSAPWREIVPEMPRRDTYPVQWWVRSNRMGWGGGGWGPLKLVSGNGKERGTNQPGRNDAKGGS